MWLLIAHGQIAIQDMIRFTFIQGKQQQKKLKILDHK